MVQHWGRFILIYCHHDCKQIEVWITCDGLGLFCSFVSLFKHQTNKVEAQNIWICLVNNFNQIGYLSENYCKIFRAIYPICFCGHTQINPASDVMFYWCFRLLTCLLCLVSNIKCCSHTVSWWLKKFGNMFVTWIVDKFDYSRRSIVSLKQNLKDYWSERNFPPQISAWWHKLNENALFVQTKCHLKGLNFLIEFSLKPLTKDCRNKNQNLPYFFCKNNFAQYCCTIAQVLWILL